MNKLSLHDISIHSNFHQIGRNIRKSEGKKAKKPLHIIKVVLNKNFNFHNINIQQNFYQNRLINECAILNSLAKRALCHLS